MTTIPITVLNLSAAVGRIAISFVADCVGPVNALFFITIMTGLSQLLVWMFIDNYAGIVRLLIALRWTFIIFKFDWNVRLTAAYSQMAFTILFGFFCESFLSLTPAMAAQLYGADWLAGLLGLLLLFNVLGQFAQIPVGMSSFPLLNLFIDI